MFSATGTQLPICVVTVYRPYQYTTLEERIIITFNSVNIIPIISLLTLSKLLIWTDEVMSSLTGLSSKKGTFEISFSDLLDNTQKELSDLPNNSRARIKIQVANFTTSAL